MVGIGLGLLVCSLLHVFVFGCFMEFVNDVKLRCEAIRESEKFLKAMVLQQQMAQYGNVYRDLKRSAEQEGGTFEYPTSYTAQMEGPVKQPEMYLLMTQDLKAGPLSVELPHLSNTF